MPDRDSLVTYVEHEGGGRSAIPDPRTYRDGGICWRLRYAPSDASILSAVSVIDAFAHLLDPHITAKDACARLRELRREYKRRM